MGSESRPIVPVMPQADPHDEIAAENVSRIARIE
jgi:hypothetical protein